MYFGLISNFYWSAIIINDGGHDDDHNNNNSNNKNNNNINNNNNNNNNNNKNNRMTSLLPLNYVIRFVSNIYFSKLVSFMKTKHDLHKENSHWIFFPLQK